MFFVNHVLKFKCLAKRMPYVKVDGSHLNSDAKKLNITANMPYRVYLIQNLYFGFTRRVLYIYIYTHTHTHTHTHYKFFVSSFCSSDCIINLICVELYNFGFRIILNIWHEQKSMNKVKTTVIYPKRFERPHCKCTHLLKVLWGIVASGTGQ
jgi:hypothetical protein